MPYDSTYKINIFSIKNNELDFQNVRFFLILIHNFVHIVFDVISDSHQLDGCRSFLPTFPPQLQYFQSEDWR